VSGVGVAGRRRRRGLGGFFGGFFLFFFLEKRRRKLRVMIQSFFPFVDVTVFSFVFCQTKAMRKSNNLAQK